MKIGCVSAYVFMCLCENVSLHVLMVSTLTHFASSSHKNPINQMPPNLSRCCFFSFSPFLTQFSVCTNILNINCQDHCAILNITLIQYGCECEQLYDHLKGKRSKCNKIHIEFNKRTHLFTALYECVWCNTVIVNENNNNKSLNVSHDNQTQTHTPHSRTNFMRNMNK